MKLRDLVRSEVMVIVDDYDTGDVVYEGPCSYNAVLGLEGECFDMSLEWSAKGGKPVALVTVHFNGRHHALKEFMEAEAEYDAFLAAPVLRYMSEEEARAEHERLKSRYSAARKDWMGC